MLHKTIEIPKDNYYIIMSKLGSIEYSIEFEDLNKGEIETAKPNYSIINRCDKIETLFNHIDDILINKYKKNYQLYNNYKDFQEHLNFDINQKNKKIFEKNYLDHIQRVIEKDENEIKAQYDFNKDLLVSLYKLLEKKYIYEKMVELFHGKIINEIKNEEDLENNYLQFNNDDEEEKINLNNKKIRKFSDSENIYMPIYYLCGICNTEDVMKFSRIVFRSGRGRAVLSLYNVSIDEDKLILDEKKYFENKQIFLIAIQRGIPFEKIQKNLEIFNFETYKITDVFNVQKVLANLSIEISRQIKILNNSEKSLLNLINKRTSPIRGVGKNYKCLYSLYRTFCKREKYIYVNLNKCKELNNFYIGDVWIPEIAFDNLNKKMNDLLEENENILLPNFKESVNNKANKRTFFQMDDFVYPFQLIVDTYGIPRYKEVNPGLFTIITFPFLFGIMFGDIGHGLLLLLFSLYIELNRNSIKNSDSQLKDIIRYRYILLLMGFFSFFCGIIYNDFMAIPLSFFSSCYINDKKTHKTIKKDKCIYPLGIDPKWYAATNDLTFMNSFKMKWSVIIGVIQMTLGIILRGLNNLFFKDYIGFIFEFIPQIIFMCLLFGYMIVLIFIKWSTDYSKDTSKAPSIITILMNLALKQGSVDGMPVWSSVEIEEKTNKLFFIISLICIPIILLPKPLIKLCEIRMKKKKIDSDFDNNLKKIKEENKEGENLLINNIINKNINEEIEPLLENDDLMKAEKKFEEQVVKITEKALIENTLIEKEGNISDIFVHQIIETIEFVLGCISNTASYLRLWALSLAHSQLSKVFFEKSLYGMAVQGNFILVILGYFLFANITISVLMGMDLMEAFLHTLRLHWVEFQNKFYYADGIAFNPYSFDLLLQNEKK